MKHRLNLFIALGLVLAAWGVFCRLQPVQAGKMSLAAISPSMHANGGIQLWRFSCPPSAAWSAAENKDWRPFGSVSVDVTVDRVRPSEHNVLSGVFFYQTKQDTWFESRIPLTLIPGKTTRFRLRLDAESPDWKPGNCLRSWDRDTLRRVTRWGIKIFTATSCRGRITIHPIQRNRLDDVSRPSRITDIRLPRAAAGIYAPIRFRVSGFYGNPFVGQTIRMAVHVQKKEQEEEIPAFYFQDFRQSGFPNPCTPQTRAFERPSWKAWWRPLQPGEYRIRIAGRINGRHVSVDAGTVHVHKNPGNRTDTGASQPGHAFLKPVTASNVFRYTGRDWKRDPLPKAECWSVPLAWCPDWGHYTAYNEFDQKIAWQFEKRLQAMPEDAPPRPFVITAQSELQRHAAYNWNSHPLSTENGGILNKPADYFTRSEVREVVLDRVRYLLARYGRYACVSGVIFLLEWPGRNSTRWIREMTAALRRQYPDLPIYATCEDLPSVTKTKAIAMNKLWKLDSGMSTASRINHRVRKGKAALIMRTPGTAALTRQIMGHFTGFRDIGWDIRVPDDAGNEIKVMCFLRTGRSRLLESPLRKLREGDWNRVFFPLNDLASWRDSTRKRATLSPYDLLTIREIGFRFFSDDQAVTLTLADPYLRGHFKQDADKRPELAITRCDRLTETPEQFRMCEWELTLNRFFSDPYDPDVIDLKAVIIQPDSTVIRHPAFYHEPRKVLLKNDTETIERNGPAAWRFRFTPKMSGSHLIRFTAAAENEKAVFKKTIYVQKGTGNGFVRVSLKDETCLEFSTGRFFFPIGHNLRSPSDRRPGSYGSKLETVLDRADKAGTFIFEKWFKRMSDAGENFARMWMCSWWCGLEWNDTFPGYHGVGYYNQDNAARMDRIVALAEKHGIYLALETMNHGALSVKVDAEWHKNPFNRKQSGGYLSTPLAFIRNRRSVKEHKKKLRYILARWGYSPSIALWGVLTEAEWPQPFKANPSLYRKWLADQSDYIRGLDPYGRPVSVQFSNPWHGNSFWRGDAFDVIRNNAYTAFARPGNRLWKKRVFKQSCGVVDVIAAFADCYAPYNKPVLLSEWGGHWARNKMTHLAAELHTGIWASYMTTLSGVTGYWWWNLVDAENLYPHYKALAAFAKDEDRRGKEYDSNYCEVLCKNKNTETINHSRAFRPPEPALPIMERNHAPAVKHKQDEKNKAKNPEKSTPPYARRAICLYNKTELFAYIYCARINRNKSSRSASGFADPSFPLSGALKLKLPVRMTPGAYHLSFWNTFTGEIIEQKEIRLRPGQKTIPLLTHRVDLALKLKKLESGR